MLLGGIGLALATQVNAAIFNFQENGINVDLGSSSTFTEGGFSITASGFDTSGNPADLFSKVTGDPTETGLGMFLDVDHEINPQHFIQLDLSNLKLTFSTIISISSIQGPTSVPPGPQESAIVYATKTAGSPLTAATSIPIQALLADGNVDVTAFVNAGYFIDVTAGAGNVLIATLSSEACPCAPKDIQYNFNGTQIIFQNTPGGSYVWFLSDGKVSGLPANTKTVLHISDQLITIPATGSSPQFVVPVPDSFITFDPAVNVATTTFDTVNDVWRMTFPLSGMAGNIFYGGVAFKVPAAGLPGGIKNVNWSGEFSTSTPGLSVAWQWHAANYSNFTSDYNSIAPKPTDDNHVSIYQNSDHAGTPEGTDPVSGKLWKQFVVGGASGGGGANYTGSGSSTIQFPPCVCP
jgi:hypothetical protein